MVITIKRKRVMAAARLPEPTGAEDGRQSAYLPSTGPLIEPLACNRVEGQGRPAVSLKREREREKIRAR